MSSISLVSLKSQLWDYPSPSSIQRLPLEIFLRIFGFLDLKSLAQVSLVCSNWKHYTLDTLMHSQSFPLDANETIIRKISALCRKYHTLRSVYLNRLEKRASKNFLDLFEQILHVDGHASYLTKLCLTLHDPSFSFNIALLQQISKCTALRELEVEGLKVLRLPGSKTSQCIDIDLPFSLKTLRLNFSTLLYPIQWHTPPLTEIVCYKTALAEPELSDLLTQSGAALQRLSLTYTSFPFSKAMTSALQKTTALTHLLLKSRLNEDLPANLMTQEDYAHYFSTLSNLTSLSFHPPPEFFTPKVIRAIAQNGASLVTLELHTDPNSPIVFDVNDLIEDNRLEQLRHLSLKYARKVEEKDKYEGWKIKNVIIMKQERLSFIPSLSVLLEQPPILYAAWRLDIAFPEASICYVVHFR